MKGPEAKTIAKVKILIVKDDVIGGMDIDNRKYRSKGVYNMHRLQ